MLKRRTIKFKISIAFLGVFLSLVLFFPGESVHANSLLDVAHSILTAGPKLSNPVAAGASFGQKVGGQGLLISAAEGTINTILEGLKNIFSGILILAVNFFEAMINPELVKQIFFSNENRTAIMTGWTLVRDFLNMFYLLILVFLAIATILRVNQFSDKKLFIFVLFSAFLINFSLPITLVVVDASNLSTSFLFNSICGKGGASGSSGEKEESGSEGEICAAKIATNFLSISSITDVIGKLFKDPGNIALKFLEVLVLMLFSIAFLFLALSFFVRYLAFWVLLILSPFAFFSFAWPSNSGIGAAWGDWSKKLFHYAAYGPVMLFFIFLSSVLLSSLRISKVIPISEGNLMTITADAISMAAVLYLFFYGYNLSRSIASGAGDAVTKVLDKGHSWATNSLKTMSGYNMAVNYGGAALTGLKQRAADKIPFGSFLFGSKEDDQRNQERVRLAVRGNKDEKENFTTLEHKPQDKNNNTYNFTLKP